MTIALRLYRATVAAPSRAALEHGNQALVTSAAAFMSAQFAMQHGILPGWIAWPLAAGLEWTYLKGLATAGTTRSRWGQALNVIAFVTSAVYGTLYTLGLYGVIPERPDPITALLLAVAHVAPLGALSLCYGMLYRARKLDVLAQTVRREQEQAAIDAQIARERAALAIEMERKRAELALWEDAQAAKMRMRNATPKMRRNAHPERADAAPQTCPQCGAALERAQWLASRRWGHCRQCKKENAEVGMV